MMMMMITTTIMKNNEIISVHFKWVPCQQGMSSFQVAGIGPNMELNKQLCTADKE
jgi:hypothetical protein